MPCWVFRFDYGHISATMPVKYVQRYASDEHLFSCVCIIVSCILDWFGLVECRILYSHLENFIFIIWSKKWCITVFCVCCSGLTWSTFTRRSTSHSWAWSLVPKLRQAHHHTLLWFRAVITSVCVRLQLAEYNVDDDVIEVIWSLCVIGLLSVGQTAYT